MRIDAHQHFWRLDRDDYGWLKPELAAIYRDFGPEDLSSLLAAGRIARTILVQAAPTVAETRFLLDIAAETSFVAGVVGWVDFEAADVLAQITDLARNQLLVGLRPMIHNIPYPDWMLDDNRRPALRAMERAGLVFDALVRPMHLSRLLVLADRHPNLQIVIDHGAKPAIRDGVLDPWRADVAALAERPNVVAKLSGLVTEAGKDWATDDIRPVVDHLISCFGPGRLIFGSDWPVVTLAADYIRWLKLAEELTADLDETNRAAIFGGNAARIYLHHRGRR